MTRDPGLNTPAGAVIARRFRRAYVGYIAMAWLVSAGVGLPFLLLVQVLSVHELRIILTTPLQPLFVVGSLSFAVRYFARYAAPIGEYLAHPTPRRLEAALARMERFPLHFWTVYLAYLVLAPSSVFLSGRLYAGMEPTGTDWVRIHLVAVIISIIVGLPIFLKILDLFGRSLRGAALNRAHVSLKTKVFLIGALMPLLIDTMLVQYYWTLTGHFTTETFVVWLLLELLAIAGSLLFVSSLSQSLRPLQGLLADPTHSTHLDLSRLRPRSTDELGVIASGYRRLLEELRVHGDILQVNNRILRGTWDDTAFAEVVDAVLELARSSLGDSRAVLILHEPETDELVGVAATDLRYEPRGHFRLRLDEPSLARTAFEQGRPVAMADIRADERSSPRMNAMFETRSGLAVPLKAEGRVLGVLISLSTESEHAYSEAEVQLLEGLTREATLAVQTQLLYRQRTEAEAALKDREEQLRLLLNSTEEAIFGVDLNGFCTFVNPACVRMLGYDSEAELLGQNMHTLIHHTRPDGNPYPKEQCRVRLATMSRQSAHSDEELHWRKDGTGFPVEYWSHPIFKDGELIGTVVTFIDITERKRQEEELRRLSEYNRLLLESSSEGIFGVDAQLRCTFANEAAADMLGYRPEELVGTHIHGLIHHSYEDGSPIPQEECFMFRTVTDDRSYRSDTEILWHREGAPIPVQVSANPIHEQGRVTGAVVIFRNVAEARAMARKMDYLAKHDSLTGLVNRREFERRLNQALAGAREEGTTHVLCYLDLDQFKVVNDTCGHVAGDELLRQLTVLLQQHMRQSDTLARLGGDEFGVLYERCPLDQAVRLASELRATVQEFRFVWEDKTFAVGMSIGVVPLSDETQSVHTALSAADAACYMAKEGGRNRVHIYQPDDADLARRQGEMQWVSRIHEALDANRFELACQPIVPIGNDHPRGTHVEILVRLRDEGGTLIPPGAFLPAAERYNLISTIDRWVVEQTLAWLVSHRGRLPVLPVCSVNLSGHSVGEQEFLEFIAGRIRDAGIPADRVCFEITETAAVANLARAARFITELKALGCRFALDDFGSGMSSFAYLKNLPVDYLKIDGNFVRDIAVDPVDRAMVQAINQVGHVMGLQTIAEFVENEAILRELHAVGVDYAQGMGIAAPAPLETLLAAGEAQASGGGS